ncbi:pentapeptide repeat-containing protein [Trichocoleus sp. DQ-U1]|uniref:pentapeptide repeat-containing protein n=1 Tax=Trichocoleus sp. DQ-U1 TaxID=2933926 RepID=UPI0032973D00
MGNIAISQKELSMNYNMQRIEELLQSFARVYNGSERLKREYDLLEQSKQLNMVVDDYRRLYEIYCQQQSENFTPVDVDSQKWVEALKYSFTKIEEDSNEFIKDCKITQNAIKLGILPDTYRNLYESYLIYYYQKFNEDNQTNPNQFKLPDLETIKDFLSKKHQKFPKNWAAFLGLKLLQGSVLISVLLSGINYVREAPKRQKQAHYQAWQIVNSARDQQTSGGRIKALEDLNNDKVSLEGLNARQANLDGINLKGAILKRVVLEQALLQKANLEKANLQEANLREANLQEAELPKANLEGATLEGAILFKTDLSGAKLETAFLQDATLEEARLQDADLERANLRKANLQGANLQGANLQGAILREANLQGANLQGADLRKARKLTPEQVKAAKNWDKAKYDPEFFKQLNSLVKPQPDTSSDTTYLLDAKNAKGIRISIPKGKNVVITASGRVHTNPKGHVSKCDVWTGPEGIKNCDYDEDPKLQGSSFMALIGQFNDGPYFKIGKKHELSGNTRGILVLKVNDWGYSDNSGSFTITVTMK